MLVAPLALLGPFAAPAFARDPDCPELHATDFTALSDNVDQLYVEQQVASARRTLLAAEKRLPCVLEVVKKDDVARFALRYAYALGGDPEAERWVALALALDPSLPWPAYIPNGHQVRDLVPDAPPAPVDLPEKGFAVEAGGGVFLDGRFLPTPRAEPGVPHLLQVGDARGSLESTWMDGTAFPEELLGPAGPPMSLPPWYSADGAPVKVKIRKEREPWSEARLANLERAFGFAAAGGALFGTALAARSAYDARATDGLFLVTDGSTVAAGTAGTASLVFLGAALFGR